MNGRESKSNISKGHSLPTRIPNRIFAAAVFCGALMVLSGTARATIVEMDLDKLFDGSSDPAPSDPKPWLIAKFDNTGLPAGKVNLTLTVANLSAPEKVDEWDFNVGPESGAGAIDPTTLSFTGPTASTGTFDNPTILTGENAFKADGDGNYDIRVIFSTGAGQFGPGDSVTYQIMGPSTLTPDSFIYLSQPSGGTGPYYTAAHIQGTPGGGKDKGSAWVTDTDRPQAVPEPSSIILGLIAGCAAIGVRSWKRGH